MLNVTDAAAEKIRALLADEDSADAGLRVGIRGGGCSGFQYHLAFEEQQTEADQVVEANGVKLFVDPKSCLYLTGATLDYRDGLMGAGFRLENPNARSTCGCGESFGV